MKYFVAILALAALAVAEPQDNIDKREADPTIYKSINFGVGGGYYRHYPTYGFGGGYYRSMYPSYYSGYRSYYPSYYNRIFRRDAPQEEAAHDVEKREAEAEADPTFFKSINFGMGGGYYRSYPFAYDTGYYRSFPTYYPTYPTMRYTSTYPAYRTLFRRDAEDEETHEVEKREAEAEPEAEADPESHFGLTIGVGAPGFYNRYYNNYYPRYFGGYPYHNRFGGYYRRFPYYRRYPYTTTF